MDENTVNTGFPNGASKTEGDIASTLARAFEAFELKNFKVVIELAQALLRSNRNIPQAHYLIGRVTIETQQLDIAVKALETAVQLDATLSDYWAFLAIVYMQTGNALKAEKTAMTAYNIGSDKAHVLYPVAHVLSGLGFAVEANICLYKAIQQSPNNPIYHRALGISLLESGDFEAAQQALRKSVALDPNDAESWWNLSSLVKAKDNTMAEQLLEIMQSTASFPRQHAFLAYAAGKLFEDTQCWDEAFAAFEQGAAAKRRTVNYEASQAELTFSALKTVCTANWLDAGTDGANQSAPIFIVGQPRTGTTLVDRIVSSHSLVHSAGEPVQLAMSLRALTGVRTSEFISAELIHKAVNLCATELAKSYLAGLANLRGDTPYFTDKFPMNFMLVGFIAKAFPKAKIIHVTRSPADSCFAVFKQLFEDVYPHSYDQREMAEHFVMYRNLMEHWHRIMPGRILDIAYEDVVSQNTAEARRLIEYIGLDWEDECINFEKNNAAVVTASAAQVREKVHSRSIGRWKKYEKQLTPLLDILKAAGIEP